MIVKNESKVILRLLQSVAKYIDCYCICDTGSTDNTIEIIHDFFKSCNPPIPGRIVREPFQDFGYNRSFALQACEELDVKYILLLDADMVFTSHPSFLKEDIYGKLTEDVYYIFQGSDHFYYKNVRIVKNKIGITYWGVTHEYVKTPEGTRYGKFEKSELFINDIGDGGCKTDKFIRDIQLLKKGLEKEKNNDRYTFYLANSYRDAGQYKNAIETYKKRIEIGGWAEEVWHSYYSIGKCYKYMGDMANAIFWWLEGYHFYQRRLENLYEIIHYYRCLGKNHIAYGFYTMAEEILKNHDTDDQLFLQKDVYDYKLEYELSIIGYYCNYKQYDMNQICMKILNRPNVEEGIHRNVLSNYKFYGKQLMDYVEKKDEYDRNLDLLRNIGNTLVEITKYSNGYYKSTPSVCQIGNGKMAVNVRYVNYWINEKGGYENPGNISTKNVIAIFDISEEEWVLEKEFILDYDRSLDNLYVGLEDIRLFVSSKDIAYVNAVKETDILSERASPVYPILTLNANRGLSYHNILVEHGKLDLSKNRLYSVLLKMEGQREVEKNWVLFEDAYQKIKTVYHWHPLVIGDIGKMSLEHSDKEDDWKTSHCSFIKRHQIPTSPIFKLLRGSTNGVRIGDEIWFICHSVSYEDRRYYYHMFVVINAYTYEVDRYTPFFTFTKQKVEYTLGFTYFQETDEFLIGYSVMDKENDYMIIHKSVIDDMFLET
jgi:tetratricopeptide (TPR) repeat protein